MKLFYSNQNSITMLNRILTLTTIITLFLILQSCQSEGDRSHMDYNTIHILRDGEVLDSVEVDTSEVLVPIVFTKQHSN